MWHHPHDLGKWIRPLPDGARGWRVVPILKNLPPKEWVICKPSYSTGLTQGIKVSEADLVEAKCKCGSP